MPQSTKEWFSEWFNSPYYHVLYKNHDTSEAESFIDKLAQNLNFNSDQRILDIPCGKGRHSVYLNQKGFNVTGVDLSEESVKYANQFSNERLKFLVHDMRKPLKFEAFDIVLNLFTSFGYFESESENYQALEVFSRLLKPGGTLVIDFMNTWKVAKNLVPKDCNLIDHIEFCIQRKIENNSVVKDISFEADGKSFHYQERIRAIYLDEFLKYFSLAKLALLEVFGDYNLNRFDPENSDRMIFILRK